MFFLFAEFAREHGGLSVDVIKKAFKETEEEFCHMVKRSVPMKPQMATVGSCCLVGAISNGTLYVANLGDSRAVLGSVVPGDSNDKKGAVAERLSTDHNVAVEEVRKEVKALNPDDSQIVIYTRGVWRIKGIIQVEQSFVLLACVIYIASLMKFYDCVFLYRKCNLIVFFLSLFIYTNGGLRCSRNPSHGLLQRFFPSGFCAFLRIPGSQSSA